jgi:micrococcal nuclease
VTATVRPRGSGHTREEAPLSRSSLGPLALIGALALLVGAAIVFFVLAIGLVRDMADGTGASDGDAEETPVDEDAAAATDDAPPADPAPGRRPAGVPADAEAAIVERVVDGDTLRVVAPPGAASGSLPDGGSVRVRLLNVDAPELARDGQPADCLAQEATDRLAALLAPGDLVWVAADAEDADRFDRLLRGIWTADGVFVNELLAAEGLATALLVGDNDRFHPPVAAAQQRARADGLGLWGEACDDR